MKYDFDDIVIVPKNLTTINSRSEVNCYNEEGMLLTITSPMDTVINHDNSYHYSNNRINLLKAMRTRKFEQFSL